MSGGKISAVVGELLTSWGLNHLTAKFEEQHIDEPEILLYLSDDQINSLTADNIGDKVRLKRGIKNLELDTEDNIQFKKQKINEIEDSDEKLISLDIEENRGLEGDIGTSDLQNVPILLVAGPSTENQNNNLRSNVSLATTETYLSSCTTDTVYSSQLSSPESILITVVNDFNLEDFLNSDILGQALLLKGRRQGLTNLDRDRLAEILVKHMLNKFGKLSYKDFDILSKKIEELMPKEKSSTYFVPPIPKSQSRRHQSEKARGKLIDKQRNLLYLVKVLSKSDSRTDVAPDQLVETEDITTQAKDSQIWLKKNTEPPAEIIIHWKRSNPIRKLSHTDTISKFMDEWPILKTQLAPELINLDFDQVQIDREDLESRFEEFFETILNTRKASLSAADNTILQLLEGELTRDSKNAIKLYLLAALVPPKTRTQLGKLHWKPSISECRDGFLIHVTLPGDIEEAKKAQVDRMYRKGLTVQPYILLVGHNLGNVNVALVVINGITYNCLSVLDALDFCYKAYQVFDAEYPFESRHIWYLIQWNIYKYFCKNDPKIPFVNDLIDT